MRRNTYLSRLCRKSCLLLSIVMLTGCSNGAHINNPDGTLNVKVYAQPSSQIGEQAGWFGEEVADRFGLRLSYRSSEENDFMLYLSQENLGDLIIFDNISDFSDAAAAGVLFDWESEDLLALYGSNLQEEYPEALERSRLLTGDGKLYGIGSDIAAETGRQGGFACVPELRWDLYETIGCPSIESLMDYIPVLKQMQELYPETEKGKKVYGVSLFKDWDDGMLQFSSILAGLYGYEQMGLGFYSPKTQEWESCLNDDGMYIQCLKFYNELYQEGLLDPDSITQDYSTALTKYQQGTVLLSLTEYLGSTIYNNWSNLSEGRALCALLPDDSLNLRYEESIYGNNSIWAIGADCIDPESCMELINWLFSPEGKLTMMYGPKEVSWNYDSNGQVKLTEFGVECQSNYLTQMPDSELSFFDGYPQFGTGTLSNTNEITGTDGQNYLTVLTDSMLSQNSEGTSDTDDYEVLERWREKVKSESTTDYLESSEYAVVPATTFELSKRDDKLDFTWVQVANCIQEYSWKAVYAASDQDFTEIIESMQEKCEAYGWEDCAAWCQEEAKKRAALEDQTVQ